jgi:uncharacterized protein YbjT (DUF2867 family)
MRVLILGAYGFIGLAIARQLHEAGHDVVGLGRDAETGRRLFPDIEWIEADLRRLRSVEAWSPHLTGLDAVINASGALQDGARDNLGAVQRDAIQALVAACEQQSVRTFVQISAPGADPAADTAFMRTKGEADQALMRSGLDWFILKPGLVIGPNAYGGTALLRMLAGLPSVQMFVFGRAKIQTVALGDVASGVCACLDGDLPVRRQFDLVSDEILTLSELVALFRRWLGLPPARVVIDLPAPLGFALARVADLAGWLGWRSPLRSTALRVLSHGILGDPRPWRDVTGRRLLDAREALAALPSTRQERIFARSQLVFPILLGSLALFWLLSGLIALWQWRSAAAVLPGWIPPGLSISFVVLGAVVDIAIGIGLLLRRRLRVSAVAAVAISLVYLAAGSILTPALWTDPLGPFVKVLPGIGLALAVLALAEER